MSLQSELRAEVSRRQKEENRQKLRAALERMSREELIDSMVKTIEQYQRMQTAIGHYRVMVQELVNAMPAEGIERAFFDV